MHARLICGLKHYTPWSIKNLPLLFFKWLHAALADFILACNIWKKLYASDCTFGHLTLILLLHYLVKCRLLSLLLASGVNVCHLHSRWRRTF